MPKQALRSGMSVEQAVEVLMLGSSDDEQPDQAGAGPAPAGQRQPPLDFQDSAPGPEEEAHHITLSMADLQPMSSGSRLAAGAAQQPPLQCSSRANPGASRFHPDTQASQTGGSQPGPSSQQQQQMHPRPQPAVEHHLQQPQQRLAPIASVPSMQRGPGRPPAAAAAAAPAARLSAQHSAPAALPARPVLPPQGVTFIAQSRTRHPPRALSIRAPRAGRLSLDVCLLRMRAVCTCCAGDKWPLVEGCASFSQHERDPVPCCAAVQRVASQPAAATSSGGSGLSRAGSEHTGQVHPPTLLIQCVSVRVLGTTCMSPIASCGVFLIRARAKGTMAAAAPACPCWSRWYEGMQRCAQSAAEGAERPSERACEGPSERWFWPLRPKPASSHAGDGRLGGEWGMGDAEMQAQHAPAGVSGDSRHAEGLQRVETSVCRPPRLHRT